MRIQKVKVIQLRDEYINTIEGQGKLENIVEDVVNFDESVEYGEDSSNIFNIAAESYYLELYSDEDTNNKKIFHDFFLGNEEFKYRFSRWEVEMKIVNPTKEQILQHIVDTWYYEVTEDEAEEISQSQAYVLEDDIFFRYIPADRVKEIFLDSNKKDLINTAKVLEKELNSHGVFVDALDDCDFKVIEDINNIFKKSVEENTGVLYVINQW